jgi:hypothetical protein
MLLLIHANLFNDLVERNKAEFVLIVSVFGEEFNLTSDRIVLSQFSNANQQ